MGVVQSKYREFVGQDAADLAAIPDLSGKVAIVTGGNTGIGFQTVQALASHGAKVYMASRSKERADSAIKKIHETFPETIVEFLPLDLTHLDSVKKAGAEFLSKETRLDILINNAGIMGWPWSLTDDGLEVHMQTNHISHFYLTMLLLPVLRKTAKETGDVRVIALASSAHAWTPKKMSFKSEENINKDWKSWTYQYGVSKISNVYFAQELAEKYGSEHIYANAVHPGVVATELLRGSSAYYGKFIGTLFQQLNLFSITPLEGALTSIYLATSKDVVEKNIQGQYYGPIAKPYKTSSAAKDETLQKDLWKLSEDVLKKRGYL